MINLFHIGQKVVCCTEWGPCPHGNTIPVFGTVYTIREFCLDSDIHPELYVAPIIGLYLEEIVNVKQQCAPDGHWGELAFNSEYFRPVNSQDVWTTTRAKEPV